jgi:hypothetical protein
MDEKLAKTLSTIISFVLAAIAFVSGFILYIKAAPPSSNLGLLFPSVALILTGAVIIAFPISRWLSRPAGKLFYAGDEFSHPQPMYSVCEGKRKNGHYQEAFDGLQKIAGEYPQEIKAYIEMIEIAIVDMKNIKLAHSVFHRGIAILQEKEDRDSLARMYKAISSRMDLNLHADRHPIGLKKQVHDYSEPRYFR